MSEPEPINVGVSLTRIHGILTRGIAVIRSLSVRATRPDEATLAGLCDYVSAFASVLHAHHDGEDLIGFPYFQETGIAAPYAQLAAEHRAMEPLIGDVEGAIDCLLSGDGPVSTLARLRPAITGLSELWHAHIPKEETHFSSEVLGRLVSRAEHARLHRQLSDFNREHSGPDYLVAPFMLYSLAPEERGWMEAALPPAVVQELVPVAWKDRWATMKPFLLD